MKYAMCPKCGRRLCKGENGTKVEMECPKCGEFASVKLDKFFLEKGLDEERDRMLLKSVVEMIKRLGMKVTQEGVESRESFELMQTLGCDVIQGYFFAKTMKYVDYCEFIDNNFDKRERAIKPDEKP